MPIEFLRLRRLMQVSLAMYVIGLITYAAFPDRLFGWFEPWTRMAGLQDTPASSERFWLALALALMVLLASSAWLIAKAPQQNLALCVPMFLSKTTGSLAGLYFFFTWQHHGSLLLIGVSDAPMALATWWFWRAAHAAANKRTPS